MHHKVWMASPARAARALAVLAAGALLVGCYDNVTTEFPAGLEPLEDNTAEAQHGATVDETLALASGESDYLWLHGRGYIRASAAKVWAALKNPEVMVGGCAVDDYTIEENTEPGYEFSFQAHYIRHEIITVEWDNNFRYGTITGSPEAPEFALIRYQKTFGNEVISLIEGSVQVYALAPDITEIQYIEHLSAIRATIDDMKGSMRQRFAKAVAQAHGRTLPPCP